MKIQKSLESLWNCALSSSYFHCSAYLLIDYPMLTLESISNPVLIWDYLEGNVQFRFAKIVLVHDYQNRWAIGANCCSLQTLQTVEYFKESYVGSRCWKTGFMTSSSFAGPSGSRHLLLQSLESQTSWASSHKYILWFLDNSELK